MNINHQKNALGYLIGFITTLLIIAIYFRLQPQIIVGNGFGWDGLEYNKYYQFFNTGNFEKVNFPFCSRIGLPYLANALNLGNELLSFKLVNLASAIIFSITIYAIARHHEFSIGYLLLTIFLSWNLFFHQQDSRHFILPILTQPL